MIRYDEQKLLFLHIPKCGGKAISRAFGGDTLRDYWDWRFVPALDRWTDFAHPTLDVIRHLPVWDELQDRVVVAVVREPTSRFFSALREHCLQHSVTDKSALLDTLDEIRIAHDPRYIHFCPQHRFTHIGNKRHVDFVVKLESIHADLKTIGLACRFGVDYFSAIELIPKVNTAYPYEAQDLETFWPLIERFYLRDFLLFDYSFPVLQESEDQHVSEFERLIREPLIDDWSGHLGPLPAYERLRERERLVQENAALRERVTIAEDLLNEAKELQDAAERRQLKSDNSRSRLRGIAGWAAKVRALVDKNANHS